MEMKPLHKGRTVNEPWLAQLFSAKAAKRGGIIRRAVADVEREVGRDRLAMEVRRRGYHMVECGGQMVVFCNRGHVRIIV